jgi:hypothetical protein
LPAESAVDDGSTAAPEFMPLFDLRMQQKMQVGGINVTIYHDLTPRQRGERGGDHCLAGSSLAADNGYLLHISS